MKNFIPVIDIFAGPGGLGEGFARFLDSRHRLPFRIVLSIEKELIAYQTLLLRAFYRQFGTGSVPTAYYEFLRGKIDRATLFERYPEQAKSASREAWHQELRRASHDKVKQRIARCLSKRRDWVLIGGPPCQAYSLAGRSRLSKINKKLKRRDKRHYLYREYLRIIADHKPAIFVMENVKGLLSSTTGTKGDRIFEKICRDLRDPDRAIYGGRKKRSNSHTYRLCPLTISHSSSRDFAPSDYVIRAERYGVPQSRHRVIILGIRSDVDVQPRKLRARHRRFGVEDAIVDLPKLRSDLSKKRNNALEWANSIRVLETRKWLDELSDKRLKTRLFSAVRTITKENLSVGAEFVQARIGIRCHRNWYYDNRLKGACNHSTRSHIQKDLHRYLFASCFAKVHGRSPTLKDFPKALLPKHRNAREATRQSLFSDRFRVQLSGRPATTITSHISKDGHYFIHPDPSQCRSLTVREAARLQTFPDNYFFAGKRTAQYEQVGNAVPPYLARQIAKVVFDVIAQRK